MKSIVVDSHMHFLDFGKFDYQWITPESGSLRRNFLPADLLPQLPAAQVDYAVVVQALHSGRETQWLLSLAAENDVVTGTVVWVDLTSRTLGWELDELQRHPKFKGVRHIIEDEPDDAWMHRPDIVAGLRELARRDIPFDLAVQTRHLRHLPRLSEECPGIRLMIDHLARPRVVEREFDEWAQNLEDVAAVNELYCKLSGLITGADWKSWTPDDLRPYITHAVQVFGYDRVMFGSDWPVCTLAASYQDTVVALRVALGPLAPELAAKVWGINAREFYRLGWPGLH